MSHHVIISELRTVVSDKFNIYIYTYTHIYIAECDLGREDTNGGAPTPSHDGRSHTDES